MELTKNKQQRVSDENKVCFGKKIYKTEVEKFSIKSPCRQGVILKLK